MSLMTVQNRTRQDWICTVFHHHSYWLFVVKVEQNNLWNFCIHIHWKWIIWHTRKIIIITIIMIFIPFTSGEIGSHWKLWHVLIKRSIFGSWHDFMSNIQFVLQINHHHHYHSHKKMLHTRTSCNVSTILCEMANSSIYFCCSKKSTKK